LYTRNYIFTYLYICKISVRYVIQGVIRVDNYWCHSAILSTRPRVSSPGTTCIPDDTSSTNPKETIPSTTPVEPIPGFSEPGFSVPRYTEPVEPKPIEKRDSTENKSPFKIKKFDPRARLNELKKSAATKKDSFSAASLKKRAKLALNSMKNPTIDMSEKKVNSHYKVDTEEAVKIPVISAVDLPGVSFITLFCDDQKVPLPSTIVDILSKQGEKVVPDSINRLHETAREVEAKKQCEYRQRNKEQ
jgi:hypothetical protein